MKKLAEFFFFPGMRALLWLVLGFISCFAVRANMFAGIILILVFILTVWVLELSIRAAKKSKK